MTFRGKEVKIQSSEAESIRGNDLVFLSAGSGPSRTFVLGIVESGGVAVDNSSAFRMDPAIPLVVPEVNPEAITAQTKVVANPNCTAIILLMALAPLTHLAKVERVIVSTYQSASGAGALAMEELLYQTREVLEGREAAPKVFPHPCAFNLFSHNTPVNEEGWNEEEVKVRQEVRKILGLPDLRINVTCVRVPVLRAHSESVTVEFEGEAPSESQVRDALAAAPGVRVVDDRKANLFPMPVSASGQGDVLVGRIRRDQSHPSALSFFVAGDQLLKGAALNAVQIAEHMHGRGLLG
jgi:aspartate-semialdehyde dehydrogenase